MHWVAHSESQSADDTQRLMGEMREYLSRFCTVRNAELVAEQSSVVVKSGRSGGNCSHYALHTACLREHASMLAHCACSRLLPVMLRNE